MQTPQYPYLPMYLVELALRVNPFISENYAHIPEQQGDELAWYASGLNLYTACELTEGVHAGETVNVRLCYYGHQNWQNELLIMVSDPLDKLEGIAKVIVGRSQTWMGVKDLYDQMDHPRLAQGSLVTYSDLVTILESVIDLQKQMQPA